MPEMNTVFTLIFSTLGWFVFSYLYISIGEHQIHKRFMHSRCLPERLYEISPYVLDVYEAHGVRHHTKWYRQFDYETDPVGREENLEIPIKETTLMIVVALPLWAPIFFLVFGGCVFLLTALLHNRLWSIFHRQMHIPKNVFFKKWAIFKFLCMNHFMHHQKMGGNFNVVFPFADFLFSTRARPTQADIREMLRLGFITPRPEASRGILEQWRAATELRRAQSA